MRLSQKISDYVGKDVSRNPSDIYRDAIEKERQGLLTRRGPLYLDAALVALAPSGNLYRYNALMSERRKHVADLWAQIDQLAAENRHVLPEGRNGAEALAEALQWKEVAGPSRAIIQADVLPGFAPFREFLSERVVDAVVLTVPKDIKECSLWFRSITLGIFIWAVQTLAPTLTILAYWNKDSNPFSSASSFLGSGSCLGRSFEGHLTLLTGFFSTTLVIFMVRLRADEELIAVAKAAQMPGDWFWLLISMIAKVLCFVATCLALLLVLWSDTSASSIVCDTLPFLVVLSLDELAVRTGLAGCSDEEFRQVQALTYMLLSRCPVSLAALVNPNADTIDNFWSLEVDSADRLLAATPMAGPGGPRRKPCWTRITQSDANENESLLGSPFHDEAFLYSKSGQTSELPSSFTRVVRIVWTMVRFLLFGWQLLLPLAYVLFNKRACLTPTIASPSEGKRW